MASADGTPRDEGSRGARGRNAGEQGVTLIEALVASMIALVVIGGAYTFLLQSKRDYVAQTDLASAQVNGRSSIEILSSDARVAGFSPLGASFDAVPRGDGFEIRLLADLNGNGTVGTAAEPQEDLSYVFWDLDGDAVYELFRGHDLNGDGDFLDTDESVDSIADNIVPIDVDGDGTDEPFLSYDAAPPATRYVSIAFGVRTESVIGSARQVLSFHTDVALRNKL